MKKSTTFFATGAVERKWYIIDAENKILGRLATQIASMLRGKNKPQYSPNADTGDFVIVVNAGKVKMTGKKTEQKYHNYYTGYPSGLKEIRYDRMLAEKPEEVITLAVKGMLPKNRLGRQLLK